MASKIDIGNLALSHLGDSADVADFDEGSAQADHCRRFYPIALNSLLEMHPWGFATIRLALAELSDPPTSTWTYAYALPTNCARAWQVLPSNGDEKVSRPFAIETDSTGAFVLFTDEQDAVLRYTRRIEETGRFPMLFTDCLSWLLASYLAGPIIKGSEGIAAARAAADTFRNMFNLAVGSDANQQHVEHIIVPSSIAARGGSALPLPPTTPAA